MTDWLNDRPKIQKRLDVADRARMRSDGYEHNQGGLTLIELLIVIGVIGVLSGIAIPFYFGQIEKARIIKTIAELDNLQLQIKNFELDYNRLPDSLAEITSDGLTDPWGNSYRYLNFATLRDETEAEGSLGLGKKEKGKAKGKAKKSQTESGSFLRLDPFNQPLNSDYDLYSCGKDGQSAPRIDDQLSEDDIVRGGNGAYIGPASQYEP